MVKHITTKAETRLKTLAMALVSFGVTQVSVEEMLEISKFKLKNFKNDFYKSHCTACNCKITTGSSGRKCKKCRGAALSDAERNVLEAQNVDSVVSLDASGPPSDLPGGCDSNQ